MRVLYWLLGPRLLAFFYVHVFRVHRLIWWRRRIRRWWVELSW